MDFQVGDELPLPGLGEHVTVMTQVSYIFFLYCSRFIQISGSIGKQIC